MTARFCFTCFPTVEQTRSSVLILTRWPRSGMLFYLVIFCSKLSEAGISEAFGSATVLMERDWVSSSFAYQLWQSLFLVPFFYFQRLDPCKISAA